MLGSESECEVLSLDGKSESGCSVSVLNTEC